MQSNQNITQQDVDSWLRSAPPEQVVQHGQNVLNTIASYPQEQRDRFSSSLKSDTKNKLFQRETT